MSGSSGKKQITGKNLLGSVLINIKKTETSVAISNRRNLTWGIGYMGNGTAEEDREKMQRERLVTYSLSKYMKQL